MRYEQNTSNWDDEGHKLSQKYYPRSSLGSCCFQLLPTKVRPQWSVPIHGCLWCVRVLHWAQGLILTSINGTPSQLQRALCQPEGPSIRLKGPASVCEGPLLAWDAPRQSAGALRCPKRAPLGLGRTSVGLWGPLSGIGPSEDLIRSSVIHRRVRCKPEKILLQTVITRVE